jgi:hypothetical protein
LNDLHDYFANILRTLYNFNNNNFGNENLEVAEELKYLGVFFSRSGSFLKAKTYIANQAIKAMYCVMYGPIRCFLITSG